MARSKKAAVFQSGMRALAFMAVVLCLGVRAELPQDEQKDAEADKIEPVRTITGKVQRQLTLGMGLSRTLEFQFEIGPIIVTDDSLMIYRRVRNNEGKEKALLLVPKKPGVTDFTIHDLDGKPRITYLIRVTREETSRVIAQLEDLLGDIEGLKIRALEGTIIMDGEILLPRDMIRIFRVVDAVSDRDFKAKATSIKNLTTISKLTMNILAERIEREIGSPEITARVVNNNIFLEGTAESDFEADRAVEIAKTYLPEVYVDRTKGEGGEVKPKQAGGVGGGLPTIVDLLRIRPRQASPPSQDIKITVNYVELKNDYGRLFSFEWKPLLTDSSTIKADTSLGEISAQAVATVTSLLPRLNNSRDHGHARILKQQQVIVKDRSDAPAVVNSEQDIYVRIVDDKGNVAFQPIKVRNEVRVKAATIPGSDSIDLGIQVTLQQVVGAGSPPSVATNNLQTQITIKNGESAALGGSAFDTANASYNRDNGKSQATGSPLFNFNRSKNIAKDKSQYIIFVTPEVIRTASAATEDMTRKFRLNAGDR